MGGFGRFIQTRWQRSKLGLELLELRVQRLQIVLDRGRGVLPFPWRKGKRLRRVVSVLVG
jgi:hypothetical protein